jgi:hypothetical protein
VHDAGLAPRDFSMKMKALLLGVASGFLLSACGGPIEEEPVTAEELCTVESALCEGWDSGFGRSPLLLQVH